MMTHPVRFSVEPSARLARIQVAIRLALLIALGVAGWSSVYWLLYLALPALAALLIAQKGGERYLAEDAPQLVRALRWLAGAYAYLWLLTDVFPTGEPNGPVSFEVEPGGTPTAGSAMLRLLYTVPALIVLTILSVAASILWVVGALFVLIRGRLPASIGDFLMMTLRYQFRLAAYHLSLVDRYPSFETGPSLHEVPH